VRPLGLEAGPPTETEACATPAGSQRSTHRRKLGRFATPRISGVAALAQTQGPLWYTTSIESTSVAHDKSADVYALSGPISSLTVLGQTLVILNDAQYANDLLEKRSAQYSARARMIFGGEMLAPSLPYSKGGQTLI
jgi:hypothetical protein